MPRFKNCACKPKILAGIEDMGDYFRQQPSTTRLVIYRLLQAPIASLQDDDLDLKAGPKGSFMKGIFEVCKNERDPDCLLVWFGVMRDFLRKYNESSSLTESTFTLFSTYFPITIRATQTPAGVTGDDLKRVLRECFAADDSIASLAVPFLTEKLERGDGMTLSARVSYNRLSNPHVANPALDRYFADVGGVFDAVY
jgi:DNA repair/transcription protein MET18/MMS19